MDNMIYPTGKCFDDALDLLVDLIKAEPDLYGRGDLVLVHARCLAPDGHSYAHAWVEDLLTQQCYFAGIYRDEYLHLSAPIQDYYAELQMQEATRYTYPEALRWNRQTGHYGPWTEQLRALCGRSISAASMNRALIVEGLHDDTHLNDAQE